MDERKRSVTCRASEITLEASKALSAFSLPPSPLCRVLSHHAIIALTPRKLSLVTLHCTLPTVVSICVRVR